MAKNTFTRKNKFNAVRQTYNGYNYDSKLEAEHAANLDFLLKTGLVTSWERQVKISLDINDIHIANYFIDFKVHFTDGRVEYHEVKGVESDLFKLKWRMSKALYPDYNFIMLKAPQVKSYLKLN